MTALTDLADFLWTSMLLLGPMLLLGLLLAGVIHVLISRELILKWLSREGLGPVATAAALGVPIPLCSCSVVPVVAEMRRKGASRSSCMSFLITAPETGADSILVTHAFFGFAAAVARPVASFVTAVVAGLSCIVAFRRRADDGAEPTAATPESDCCKGDGSGHKPLVAGADDCYVSPAQFKAAFKRLFGGAEPAEKALGLKAIGRHALRYGFVEVADDILFALVLGVLLGGVLYLAIPDNLMANEYARWLAYPAMVLVGVPIYICASASTPIAAALVAKGFSPGAALVFLMTGPATNTGTIAIIVNRFGSRFATIYVGAVVAVTVTLGVLIDVALALGGWSLAVNLAPAQSTTIALAQWFGAFGLLALIAWRFHAGALASGVKDMVANLRFRSRRSPLRR